jgi:hypothetical protein
MITMFAHHAVVNYETWISGAKEAMNDPARNTQSGIVGSKVYRTADGSGVIVMHTFNNIKDAQAYENMMQSPEGHAMVEKMGAKLPITIWLAEEVRL